MRDALSPSAPRPTVTDHAAREVGAAVEADSLQVLLDVLQLQRRVRDRLDRVRTERFRAGDSPFDVGVSDLESDPDLALLPPVTRRRLECTADERWHEIHRSMLLAGYPPAAADGRCTAGEAVAAIPPGETAGDRTVVCAGDQVEPAGRGAGIRVHFDGGRATLALRLESEAPPADLLADADHVHVTHHSASALEAARSLGGALADTPAIAVLFERADPPRRYGDRDQGVGTLVERRLVEALEGAAPLPDGETAGALAEALETGPFTTDERLAICRLLAGETGCIRLRYGTGVPRLVAAIAALADCDLVHVPQTGAVLLTAAPVPPAVETLADAFPERQHLTAEDCEALSGVLGCPAHAASAGNREARHRATAIAVDLAAGGDLSPAAAFYLEVSPWIPRPEPAAVRDDIAAGRRIVEHLVALEERVDASLASPALETCWERAAGPDAGPYPTG